VAAFKVIVSPSEDTESTVPTAAYTPGVALEILYTEVPATTEESALAVKTICLVVPVFVPVSPPVAATVAIVPPIFKKALDSKFITSPD
jgi:hypothetical protein